MSIPRKSLSVFCLAVVGCALMVWGIWFREKQPWIARAQAPQANAWTTPEAQRLGIRLLDARDPSGPAAYPVAPGDLLFFTNSGNEYASQNTRNSVVVINARTRKPIAVSDLDSLYTEKYGSHGIGLSPDGKYIYLPNIESINGPGTKTPNSTLILDARTLKIYQVLASGGTPHHAKAFRDPAGKPRVFIEDWTWNSATMNGQAFYVVDPTDNNKVVAGMTAAEIHGGTYTGFTTPDSKFMYYSVPPPYRHIYSRPRRHAALVAVGGSGTVEALIN